MNIVSILLAILLSCTNLAHSQDVPNDPLYTKYESLSLQTVTWPLSTIEQNAWGKYNIYAQQAKIILDDPFQDYDTRYRAASLYIEYLVDFSDYDNARYYCSVYPPKIDHYEYLSNCLRMSNDTVEFIAKSLDAVGEEAAREFPKGLVANKVYKTLGSYLNNLGHVHAAI